jgi:hypothetical protein
MNSSSTSNNTKSIIKELNKEWREYTRKVDNIIDNENIHIQKNITFIIRVKKNGGVSLCDIIEDELKKIDKLLDVLNKD